MAISNTDLLRYFKEVQGHYIDMDRVYGAQCWDQWAHYAAEFLGVPLLKTYANHGGSHPHPGYACNVYHNARTAGLEAWFEILPANTEPLPGDVVFWEFGSTFYPLSHVATVVEVVSPDLLRCITQNPTNVMFANLIRRGVIGYLRPKAPHMPPVQSTPETRVETEDEDMTLTYMRATTNSTPLKKGDAGSSRIWAADKNGFGTRVIDKTVWSGVWELKEGAARRLTDAEWTAIDLGFKAAGRQAPVANVHGNIIETIIHGPSQSPLAILRQKALEVVAAIVRLADKYAPGSKK